MWQRLAQLRIALSKFKSQLRREIRLKRALRAVRPERSGRKFPSRRQHGLPGKLFVSLTSYPPRFATLHLTIRSLLDQSVRPDAILLWIAHDDIAALPDAVRAFESEGLLVRPCEDLRSFKKLVPAIEQFPDAYLASADDDLYYPPHWLAALVDSFDPARPVISCHRAHRVKWEEGKIAPYVSWAKDVQDASARMPSVDILPTTGAGALFFPGCFGNDVCDRALFQAICPEADDLWFYWMSRKAGSRHRKVGGKLPMIPWPRSQEVSLFTTNGPGGNDRQIQNLLMSIGPPWPDSEVDAVQSAAR